MLQLLQRMYKLSIQEQLQSQAARTEHGIMFPRQEKYGNMKDGCSTYEEFQLSDLTNDKLVLILEEAEMKAKKAMEELGMKDDLEKSDHWVLPPLADCMKGNDDRKQHTDDDEEREAADDDPSDDPKEEMDEKVIDEGDEALIKDLEKLRLLMHQ